jgi:hypothetical protein
VIPELVQGILKSGSLVLSRISREVIRGEKTLESLEKHFSVQLASPHWKDGGLRRRMLETASGYVETDTLIAVDLSDIAKPRARKMEGLGWVWDGSLGEVSRGYWTFQAYTWPCSWSPSCRSFPRRPSSGSSGSAPSSRDPATRNTTA